MPKGVPKNGFRMTRARRDALNAGATMNEVRNIGAAATRGGSFSTASPVGFDVVSDETDEEIATKLAERFDVLETVTNAAIAGTARAMIVSGPPGLGKTYTVDKAIKEWDPNRSKHRTVKGYVRPTGLYKVLFANRHPNSVVIFDDSDSVFNDEVSVDMLKSVCDTTEERYVSYLSEATLIDEESGEPVPSEFLFEGTIIFITNTDFEAEIARGTRAAPHLEALVSRSLYIDLAMKTRRDYLVRIRQVIGHGMLREHGLNEVEEREVIDYIEENVESLRELSLRMAVKLAGMRKAMPHKWKSVAKIAALRDGGKKVPMPAEIVKRKLNNKNGNETYIVEKKS
jgi:hypothetical protein